MIWPKMHKLEPKMYDGVHWEIDIVDSGTDKIILTVDHEDIDICTSRADSIVALGEKGKKK